jgi:hypothetical protein
MGALTVVEIRHQRKRPKTQAEIRRQLISILCSFVQQLLTPQSVDEDAIMVL